MSAPANGRAISSCSTRSPTAPPTAATASPSPSWPACRRRCWRAPNRCSPSWRQGRAATGGIAAGLDDLPLFAAVRRRGSGARPGPRRARRDRARQPGAARGAGAALRLKRLPGRERRMKAARRPPPARDHRPARDRRRGSRAPDRAAAADDPQGGARRRPRRDRAAARGQALCRHRGRRGLCLPDRPDPPPRLRFRHPAAPSARQCRPPRSGCC